MDRPKETPRILFEILLDCRIAGRIRIIENPIIHLRVKSATSADNKMVVVYAKGKHQVLFPAVTITKAKRHHNRKGKKNSV